MTNTTVTLPNVLCLPGRTVTVEYANNDGDVFRELAIVVDVPASGTEYTVQLVDGGQFDTVDATRVQPSHPDRPRLAFDEFIVGALGEELARRAGEKALAGFHEGHNNGRISYTEAAREVFGRIDSRTLAVKHSRCHFSFVETSAGERRTNPTDYMVGDVLVECDFYVDGPSTFYCGVHRPLVESGTDRPCVFHAGATEAERQASRDRGELVHRAPIVAPRPPAEAPVDEPAERVLTDVEVRLNRVDHLVDVAVGVLVFHHGKAQLLAETPPMPGPELREQVEQALAEAEDTCTLGGMWWEALAHGLRTGRLRFHQGPAWTLANPAYQMGEGAR